MTSLALALSGQQAPSGHGASTILALGAALLIVLSIRAVGRSLEPVIEVLRSFIALGFALLLAIVALALVILSLFI
ncbi:MAG: hypothetical protein SYR96_17890 [Actinomycetota bacterium]|nr:hypothetical protein [Actinomycetota bacterium]